jgi:hypothetical protein
VQTIPIPNAPPLEQQWQEGFGEKNRKEMLAEAKVQCLASSNEQP